ncbi:Na-translocating system protein MpsC family protein [Bacillus sp. AK128]
MDETIVHLQKEISGYIGKLFREIFGKGPQSVNTTIGYTFTTIYMRNFLSPSERVLLDQDQEMTILQLRDKLMESITPEVRAYIEIQTGKKIREVYYDWNLHNKSAMITCISDEPLTLLDNIDEEYKGKEAINQEISLISEQAQKVPEEIYSCQLNERTILIIRNGILVRIEKELIRLGHGDLLRRVKRNLEKTYLHNTNQFQAILKNKVVDVLVDWDFELDKSVIMLIMNPTEPRKYGYSQIDKE